MCRGRGVHWSTHSRHHLALRFPSSPTRCARSRSSHADMRTAPNPLVAGPGPDGEIRCYSRTPSDDGDRSCLRALVALGHGVADLLVLLERAVAARLDLRVVDENVRTGALGGDEPEALLSVEPLDGALCHGALLAGESDTDLRTVRWSGLVDDFDTFGCKHPWSQARGDILASRETDSRTVTEYIVSRFNTKGHFPDRCARFHPDALTISSGGKMVGAPTGERFRILSIKTRPAARDSAATGFTTVVSAGS